MSANLVMSDHLSQRQAHWIGRQGLMLQFSLIGHSAPAVPCAIVRSNRCRMPSVIHPFMAMSDMARDPRPLWSAVAQW